MKLGYTLWNDYHFTNYREILAQLREIDVKIITVVPQYLLDRDDRARLVASYLPIKNVIEESRLNGFELMIKPHFIPRNANGKQPSNWQGWIGTVDMNSWSLLMGRIKLEIEGLARDYSPQYLCIGSDLFGTHDERDGWQSIIDAVTPYDTSIVYANTFFQPLLRRFRWSVFWASIFGVHQRILDLALPQEQFEIPSDQRSEVAKSIYRSGFRFELDAVGLNLNWPPADQKYENLNEIWSNYSENNFEINYVESVELWRSTKPLWMTECDLVGQHRSDPIYYQEWWESCVEIWADRCEMMICREQGDQQWIEMVRRSELFQEKIAEWKKIEVEKEKGSLSPLEVYRKNIQNLKSEKT